MGADLAVDLVVVAAVAAALRLLPSLMVTRASSDAGYHLLLRREIRECGFRMPRRVAALALDERQTYPWLFHTLLACVPERVLGRGPGLPSALIDAALAVLAAVLAAQTVPGAPHAALIAGLLVATSPALLAVGIGPRAYEITPRPLGEFWWAVGLAMTLLAVHGGESRWWVLAAFALACALLSSKFAAQVMLFCLPPLAVVTTRLEFLALPPAAVILALLMSGGRYWWILKGQIVHLRLYRRKLQYDHPSLDRRLSLRLLYKSIAKALAGRLRDRRRNRRAAMLLENHPIAQFLLRNIAILLLGVLIMVTPGSFAGIPWAPFLLAWAFVPFLPFLATLLPGWRFLGEAERYLEYGTVPVSVLLAGVIAAAPAGVAAGAVAAYGIVAAAVYGYGLIRRSRSGQSEPTGDTEALVAFLRSLPEGTRIMTIPLVTLAFALAHRVRLHFVATIDPFVWATAYEQLFRRYPWPTTDLDWWHRTHGAEYVVVSRNQVRPEAGCTWTYPLEKFPCVFQNSAFVVHALHVPAVPGAPVALRSLHA